MNRLAYDLFHAMAETPTRDLDGYCRDHGVEPNELDELCDLIRIRFGHMNAVPIAFVMGMLYMKQRQSC